MKARLFSAVGLAVLLGLALPRTGSAAEYPSIYAVLALMEKNTVLFVAVTETKEAETLKGDPKYTLFAPTDAAFKALDDATIMRIATDPEMVRQLLRAHLVAGEYRTAKLKELNGKELTTLQGNALKVEDTKDGLRVGGVKIVGGETPCKNGVIHVLDAVLPVK